MPTNIKELAHRTFEEIWNQKKIDVADELIDPTFTTIHSRRRATTSNNIGSLSVIT